MNPEARLAEIVAALAPVGLNSLVMGGHAVRFYGVDRNTGDFDLHLAPDCWDDLPQALSRTSLFAGRPLIEGPSWRPNAFRAEISKSRTGCASGREEWLEFRRRNHTSHAHLRNSSLGGNKAPTVGDPFRSSRSPT